MKYINQTEYWVCPETGEHRYDLNDMYSDFEDPWGCSTKVNSLSNRFFLELLFPSGVTYDSFLDLGCGLGHMTNLINLKNQFRGKGVGCDISSIAVSKAKRQYPDIEFLEFDILKNYWKTSQVFELIIVSEVLWQISNRIDTVMQKIKIMLKDQGKLGIHQYFPRKQDYFKSEIDGESDFFEILNRYGFQTLEHVTVHSDEGKVILLLLENI